MVKQASELSLWPPKICQPGLGRGGDAPGFPDPAEQRGGVVSEFNPPEDPPVWKTQRLFRRLLLPDGSSFKHLPELP